MTFRTSVESKSNRSCNHRLWCNKGRERTLDRQTDRQTEADTETERQTQTHTHTPHTQRERERERRETERLTVSAGGTDTTW